MCLRVLLHSENAHARFLTPSCSEHRTEETPMTAFDPTSDDRVEVMTPFHNAMVGKAPSDFIKIRVEMTPDELRKIIGYDPRGFQPIKKGSKLVESSKHVSQELTELV